MSLSLHYPHPPLAGDRFLLRPWRHEDAPKIVIGCRDPETQRFIPVLPRAYRLEDAEWFIGQAAPSLEGGTAIQMAIADPGSDEMLGAMTFHTPSPQHWYVGYWITPTARNRGVTTAALTAFTRWAFADFDDLVRISLYTDPDNGASQRVAEHAGFVREGVLRSWDHSAGHPEDVVMHSLIRADLA